MDILQDLLHWTTGWTDWNLILDPTGGPNHLGNRCDANLIADPDDSGAPPASLPGARRSVPYYEVVLSGWANTRSQLRAGRHGGSALVCTRCAGMIVCLSAALLALTPL